MVSCALLVVFAAGLHRHLQRRTHSDSIVPGVAAIGLVMVCVAQLLGAGLTTEFALGLADPDNVLVPVTVVEAAGNVVTDVKTHDKDGYAAVQLGYGRIDPRKVNKPMSGHFERAGVPPRRFLVEIRTGDASSYEVGQEIGADTFTPGEGKPLVVDVVGTSKGKGYAGVMKRHNFKGLGAAHGVHRAHRRRRAAQAAPSH